MRPTGCTLWKVIVARGLHCNTIAPRGQGDAVKVSILQLLNLSLLLCDDSEAMLLVYARPSRKSTLSVRCCGPPDSSQSKCGPWLKKVWNNQSTYTLYKQSVHKRTCTYILKLVKKCYTTLKHSQGRIYRGGRPCAARWWGLHIFWILFECAKCNTITWPSHAKLAGGFRGYIVNVAYILLYTLLM